jgi:hypothetical protein
MTQDENQAQTAIDVSNVAEIFHTALRKAVDGKASVASWNMLHTMTPEVRSSFYTHLAGKLAAVTFDAAALRKAALSWSREYPGDWGLHEVNAFGAVLELHPAEDWVSISQFFRSCGAAPEMGWDEDARSLWVDGRDFEAHLSFRDREGMEFASASRSPVMVDGDWVPAWRVDAPGLEGFSVRGRTEALPDVVDTLRERVAAARLAKRDLRSRPEAVAALEGIDLAPPLDPSNDEDGRFLRLVGDGAELVMRRPSRVEGKDSVMYVFRKDDPAQPSGHFFGYARIRADDPSQDRVGRSAVLSEWLDETARLDATANLGTDDDLVRATVGFTSDGSSIDVTVRLEKVASDARVLAERRVSIAVSAPYAGTGNR